MGRKGRIQRERSPLLFDVCPPFKLVSRAGVFEVFRRGGKMKGTTVLARPLGTGTGRPWLLLTSLCK